MALNSAIHSFDSVVTAFIEGIYPRRIQRKHKKVWFKKSWNSDCFAKAGDQNPEWKGNGNMKWIASSLLVLLTTACHFGQSSSDSNVKNTDTVADQPIAGLDVQTIDDLESYIAQENINSVDELIERLPTSFTQLDVSHLEKHASDAAFVRNSGALCLDDVDPINHPRVLLLATVKEETGGFDIGGTPRAKSSLWLTFTTRMDEGASCKEIIELIEVQDQGGQKLQKFAKGTFITKEDGAVELEMIETELLAEVQSDSFSMFSAEENCGRCHTSPDNKPVLIWDGGAPGITLFYWSKGANWSRFFGRRTLDQTELESHASDRDQMLAAASENPRVAAVAQALARTLDQLAPEAVPMQREFEQGAPEHFLHFDIAAFRASMPDMIDAAE